MKALMSVLGSGLVLYLLIKWTYKIGEGLGYWGPFVMVMVGLFCGLAFGIAKLVVKKNSEK